MWVLLIAIGGFTGVSDVKHAEMTKDQCIASLTELSPLYLTGVDGVCVGPNGQVVRMRDVKRAAPTYE